MSFKGDLKFNKIFLGELEVTKGFLGEKEFYRKEVPILLEEPIVITVPANSFASDFYSLSDIAVWFDTAPNSNLSNMRFSIDIGNGWEVMIDYQNNFIDSRVNPQFSQSDYDETLYTILDGIYGYVFFDWDDWFGGTFDGSKDIEVFNYPLKIELLSFSAPAPTWDIDTTLGALDGTQDAIDLHDSLLSQFFVDGDPLVKELEIAGESIISQGELGYVNDVYDIWYNYTYEFVVISIMPINNSIIAIIYDGVVDIEESKLNFTPSDTIKIKYY